MLDLGLAAFLFAASHLIPAMPPVRRPLVARLGARLYGGLYGTLSLVLLGWLLWTWSQAPFVPLWQAAWTRWVPAVAMPVASILLVVAATQPNPLSLALPKQDFAPHRPGLLAVTRHPFVWALTLWALAHIPPNGDLAALLLFGPLALLGPLGALSLDAKRRALLGRETWRRMAANTGSLPFLALLGGRVRYRPAGGDALRVIFGLLLFKILYAMHTDVIGMPPHP